MTVRIENLTKKRIVGKTIGLDIRALNGKTGRFPTHYTTIYNGVLRRVYSDVFHDCHYKTIQLDGEFVEVCNFSDFICQGV